MFLLEESAYSMMYGQWTCSFIYKRLFVGRFIITRSNIFHGQTSIREFLKIVDLMCRVPDFDAVVIKIDYIFSQKVDMELMLLTITISDHGANVNCLPIIFSKLSKLCNKHFIGK